MLRPGHYKCALGLQAVKSSSNKVPVVKMGQIANFASSASLRKTFEPDYLDSAGPVIPTYPPLNVQIKGYDFDILESFQSLVHNVAENMGINVEDCWVTPPRTYNVSTFHEGGTRVRDVNNIIHYERNVQLVGLRSVDAPILLDIIRTCLPEGVDLSVHPHEQHHYEERWIPDPFIDGIRKELREDEESKSKEIEAKKELREKRETKKQEMLLKNLIGGEDDE